MVGGDPGNPYLDFQFVVEIDSVIVAGFSEVTGLSVELETEEYEEGGINGYTHTFPKRFSYSNLTFKKGLTDTENLWGWVRKAVLGEAERQNGRVIMLDNTGQQARGWEFIDAYPVRWEGPDLAADGGRVAMETLEITHEGLRKHGGGP